MLEVFAILGYSKFQKEPFKKAHLNQIDHPIVDMSSIIFCKNTIKVYGFFNFFKIAFFRHFFEMTLHFSVNASFVFLLSPLKPLKP